MKALIIAVAAIVSLAGCASTQEYTAYVEAQKAIHSARAQAETARYQALAEIAKTGDTAAKVAAVISLNQGAPANSSPNVAMPISNAEVARQWASILVPAVTQGYIANQGAKVAITQSNNSASVAKSTNETFANIAGQIQAPGTTYNNSFNQDSTHTPTVVIAPDPVIVNPVIVQPQVTPTE